MYSLILLVHIFVCLILVAVILLQAGRGGGVADTFGGAAQSAFGSRGAAYLTRATTTCAILFMCTSMSLAFLSARRGRSLMETVPPAAAPVPPQPMAVPETSVPVQQP